MVWELARPPPLHSVNNSVRVGLYFAVTSLSCTVTSFTVMWPVCTVLWPVCFVLCCDQFVLSCVVTSLYCTVVWLAWLVLCCNRLVLWCDLFDCCITYLAVLWLVWLTWLTCLPDLPPGGAPVVWPRATRASCHHSAPSYPGGRPVPPRAVLQYLPDVPVQQGWDAGGVQGGSMAAGSVYLPTHMISTYTQLIYLQTPYLLTYTHLIYLQTPYLLTYTPYLLTHTLFTYTPYLLTHTLSTYRHLIYLGYKLCFLPSFIHWIIANIKLAVIVVSWCPLWTETFKFALPCYQITNFTIFIYFWQV